ncbi:MAG: tetratricopeptide repeat protein [Puniceicoccaceae bacterium]
MGNDSPSNPEPDTSSHQEKKGFGHFWAELRRRKVVRVAITYAVVAWLIIQVASTTFEGFGIPIWAFRFVMLCVILGFPLALIITWAFELTPDGIALSKTTNQESDSGQESAAHNKKRNWMAYGVGALLPTVIFGSLALFFFIRSSGSEDLDKSIAVLPFENRSNLDEDQFFTDGIHDDLLTHISRISSIRTISRTSVEQYREKRPNIRQIADELMVSTILEGGVQRAGDQIRINVQLIDARNDEHIWAEIYTREMTAGNIFSIQNEIATAIAKQLKAVLLPEEIEQLEKLPTDNFEALEAYFKAIANFEPFTSEGVVKAIEHLKHAIKLDPEFALAHAQLGRSYIAQIYHGGFPGEDQTVLARPHISRALELDPLLSEAHLALGSLEYQNENLDEAEYSLLNAVRYGPNSQQAHWTLGHFLFWERRDAEAALPHFEKAGHLNPNGNRGKDVAYALIELGRIEEAKAILDELLAKRPEDTQILSVNAGYYNLVEYRYDLAIKHMRMAVKIDPNVPNHVFNLANFYYRMGDRQTHTRLLAFGMEQFPDSYLADRFRIDYFWSIEEDQAYVNALREAVASNPEGDRQLSELAGVEWRSGRPKDAFDLLNKSSNARDWYSGNINSSNMMGAIDLLKYSRACGKEEVTRDFPRLIEHIIQTARRKGQFGISFADAHYYLVQGETDKALEALGDWVKIGGCGQLFLDSYSFESIKDDPEFKRLAAIVSERLAEQRANLARMEASGELAPVPAFK